ncbi:nuclear transport factor 2 family protein [Croceicoccus mobilis]|uniref:SnoaL-like domain-containing protein n=1 Tax=Croceicoccus mobilis TaxID=1703339 RepID=A0A916Z7U4_9SPHN|nr:nuclear transport factor 2 family protein [Croceicoccus mobilis]GGD80689.1 hypothetical protein GCM10010990_33220 [Croceicoccus mobilis]
MDIETIGARLALEDLAGRYARAIDRRDMELLRSVYHPDAIDEHGTAYQGGVDGFIAAMPALMGNYEVTQHQIHSKVFAIEGDKADGELYFTAYHRTSESARHLVVHGRYLDNYEKREGAWKIAYRRLVWDAILSQDVLEEDARLLDMLGENGAAADDYSYRCLPLMPRGG